LERGQRVTELMKQAQYSPLSVGEMGISLLAANEGYLDDVEVNQIVAFELAMHAYINDKYSSLIAKINESGAFNDEIEAEMKTAIEDFKANGAY